MKNEGGVSYIAKRHSKANNKYLQSYGVNEPSKLITYLDANNLCGWAMSQYLPYSGFRWSNKKESDKFCLNSIECNFNEENSSDGHILEADLEYPDKLHELNNYYQLAPKKLESSDMFSNYCSNIANEYGINIDCVNKLVPNLGNKCKYVLHYKNLIFIKNFVAIHEIKPVLTLDKPVYVGFSILDLSKLIMYEFHYKYIKRKSSAKLLFTDTDSLVYETETDDVYEDFYEDKNLFDSSDYPRDFLILLIKE